MEATSLSHVNMANEDAKKAKESSLETLDKIQIPTDILPSEKIEEGIRNIIFKLVHKKKGRAYLDNCCDNVINPKTQRPERIWLLNGAHSIWDSELENILKDKNRYERSRRGRDIIFIDGVCRIISNDVLALEFMRVSSHNVGKRRVGAGKYDFYEYDPQEEQKERMQKQMLKIQMVLLVEKMDDKKVQKLSSFFGIPFVDDLGMPKSVDGLRTELMLKADSDPVTFQKYVDSTEVDVSYMVKRAIIDAKIDLGGEGRNATWSKSCGFIAKVPINRKPYEYLTELAMTNSEEGRAFLEQLKQLAT